MSSVGGLMVDSWDLDGRVAVVTGGGSGLGKAMALALARAGADVAVAGRRPGPIAEVAETVIAGGTRGLAVPTDVTDSAQVQALISRVFDELGRVDILINNAGMVADQGGVPIWEVSDEEWRTVIDTNLTSAFYCSRAVARHMVDRGSGKIINVASGFGLRGGRDSFAYGSSKGGVVQLTMSLAVSLGRYGITSNCLVPGYFETEGTAASRENLPDARFIPVGRAGMPAELGSAAVLLASPASDYMNGEIFIIDGGGLAGGYAPTGHAPVIPLDV